MSFILLFEKCQRCLGTSYAAQFSRYLFASWLSWFGTAITRYPPVRSESWISFRTSAMSGTCSSTCHIVTTSKETFFDVVTMWHVLEHVPDMAEVLNDIQDSLRTGGYLVIAVPNHESHDANKYRENWAAYDVPRHLWHFSKRSMKLIGGKNGFDLVATHPMKLDAYYVSILSEKYRLGEATL